MEKMYKTIKNVGRSLATGAVLTVAGVLAGGSDAYAKENTSQVYNERSEVNIREIWDKGFDLGTDVLVYVGMGVVAIYGLDKLRTICKKDKRESKKSLEDEVGGDSE